MATLVEQVLATTGLNPDPLAAASGGGDDFVNTGRLWVEVKNDDVSSTNVTFVTQKTEGGLAIDDQVVAVPAGERRLCGPFATGLYNIQSGVDEGKLQITYSSVVSLTIGVFRLPALS